jgi:hypothetical protein
MLPCDRGAEADAGCGDCAYIAYARCREGERVVIPFTEEVVVPSEDQFVVAMGSRSRRRARCGHDASRAFHGKHRWASY